MVLIYIHTVSSVIKTAKDNWWTNQINEIIEQFNTLF